MKPSIISTFGRLIVAVGLIIAVSGMVFGKERISIDELRELDQQWKIMSQGQAEFEVSDPTLVPNRLAALFTESNCRWQDRLNETPLRIVTIAKHRLGFLHCHGIVGSDEVFDLTDLRRPKPLNFPFFARPDGFGTTTKPGSLTWKAETGVLEAFSGTDFSTADQAFATFIAGAEMTTSIRAL